MTDSTILPENHPATIGSTKIYPGDLLYAGSDIENDGSHPDYAVGHCMAPAGTRGVLLRVGHPEEDATHEVCLVRFETKDGELGPPVGCWASELTTSP